MNKHIDKRILIPIVVGLMIMATAFFLLHMEGTLDPNHGILRGDKTCEDCHGKYGEKVSIAPKDLKLDMTETHYNISPNNNPIYSYAFWFNNPNCNDTNTETHYENKKVDGSWQIVTVMTCLNETVRVIPQ
jgi:hypothetical protein